VITGGAERLEGVRERIHPGRGGQHRGQSYGELRIRQHQRRLHARVEDYLLRVIGEKALDNYTETKTVTVALD